MTRRTSLQHPMGYAAFQGPTVYDLACGYLPEFPHDIAATLNYPREDFQSSRIHRLSHPHLTFASTMSSMSRRQTPNGHRNSQPSLLYYARSESENNEKLKHVPSQPILPYVEKRVRLSDPSQRYSHSLTRTHHYFAPHYSSVTPPQTGMFTSGSKNSSPSGTRKLPRASEKRILQRHPQSDLAFRFQRHNELHSTESTPARQIEPQVIDPVYLALKQATGRYLNSRRGSSAHNFDSASPSPRNLSQVSLQDSGYAETSGSRNQLLGSTPMLDHPALSSATITSGGRPRAPKLNKQMKSLSLDCAEIPSPVSNTMRLPYRAKPVKHAQEMSASSGTSDWERSVSPVGPVRRLPSQPPIVSTHVVTHEYSHHDCYLLLGERLMIVDNGDPDWLHGIKINDQSNILLTFPKTCVAPIIPGEQPMKLSQNVNLIDSRIRLYRDQVVFAQPNSMQDDRIKVRNERGKIAECPLMYLTLL